MDGVGSHTVWKPRATSSSKHDGGDEEASAFLCRLSADKYLGKQLLRGGGVPLHVPVYVCIHMCRCTGLLCCA